MDLGFLKVILLQSSLRNKLNLIKFKKNSHNLLTVTAFYSAKWTIKSKISCLA
ncbi:hypothetical protein FD21_GL001250 [Liquorilactobacillus vini DSM 20605]|uniref:Uncharacterized protein n=1 Tax=Liquorilactobacillus vini DSM 20605 TaxID=1133569 RepID=A0A0R2C8P2_9LACO|nr:hypothetical protein FD21_GL001250 [Liquorilactobacillus vini DSM 20605]